MYKSSIGSSRIQAILTAAAILTSRMRRSSVGQIFFNALVNWVEHGVAPNSIVAYNKLDPAQATIARPICKYPDEPVRKGAGSTSAAASFTCQQQPNDDFFTSDLALPDLGANNGVGQLQTLNK